MEIAPGTHFHVEHDTKTTLVRGYFRYLLCAVTAHSALFEILLAFSHFRNFKFAWCLEGLIFYLP